MNSQYSENSESLRSERMTEDEARAVIDLWQREQARSGGLTECPAVSDVAEALDISIEQTRRLLRAVRTQRGRTSAQGRSPMPSVPENLNVWRLLQVVRAVRARMYFTGGERVPLEIVTDRF